MFLIVAVIGIDHVEEFADLVFQVICLSGGIVEMLACATRISRAMVKLNPEGRTPLKWSLNSSISPNALFSLSIVGYHTERGWL